MNVELPMCLLNWINQDEIYWWYLAKCPSKWAMQLLEKKLNQINKRDTNGWEDNHASHGWDSLCGNESEAAIKLLEKNPNKISWGALSENPLAMQLIENNQDKIQWQALSRNNSQRAVQLLEKNPEKIEWEFLSQNKSEYAMQFLEKNPNKINWENLSSNPSEGAIKLL